MRPESRPRLRRGAVGLLGLIGALYAIGCASTPPRASTPGGAPTSPFVEARDIATQRLFRARVSSRDGDADVRLVLRWVREDRFRLSASDIGGRGAWQLAVDGNEMTWRDLARGTTCRASADRAFSANGATFAIPAREVAAVLSGKLPAKPTRAAIEATGAAGTFDFVDASGRRWSGELADGGPRRWTLRIGDRPVLWMSRDASGSILSDAALGVQIRWRETAREPLAESGLAPEADPASTRALPPCSDADVP